MPSIGDVGLFSNALMLEVPDDVYESWPVVAHPLKIKAPNTTRQHVSNVRHMFTSKNKHRAKDFVSQGMKFQRIQPRLTYPADGH
jgi:hypothetical protein